MQKDAFLKWADVALSQANDLWVLGIPMVVLNVVVLASILDSRSRSDAYKRAHYWLYASLFCSSFSLIFSYLAKAAILYDIRKSLEDLKLEIQGVSRIDVLVQFGFFFLAVIAFLIAFRVGGSPMRKAILAAFKGG
ncbi:hypothetical protein ACXHXG_30550 [Rhizobium sp. LEGMi198b]